MMGIVQKLGHWQRTADHKADHQVRKATHTCISAAACEAFAAGLLDCSSNPGCRLAGSATGPEAGWMQAPCGAVW